MAYELKSLFDSAMKTLEANPRGRLAAISGALRVERHTVERAFQLRACKSFREVRREMLLEKAKNLLASQPTAPIKGIACLLGYKSERAFARFIRNALGCCPCELRRKLKGPGQPAREAPKADGQSSAAQIPQPRRFVRTAP